METEHINTYIDIKENKMGGGDSPCELHSLWRNHLLTRVRGHFGSFPISETPPPGFP